MGRIAVTTFERSTALGFAGGVRPVVWWLGLTVFIATAAWNIGIIAMDDYYDIIAHFIPAQQHSISQILEVGGIRSPVPRLLLLGLSKTAYALGISDPIGQLRFVLMIWAAFSYLVLAGSLVGILQVDPKKNPRQSTLGLCLMSFYFVCPLLLTRPMIESLCAPFLLASAYYACAYFQSPRPLKLLTALFWLSLAFLMRFQVVSCLPVLFALPVLLRRWKDVVLMAVFSGLAFVLTGLLDGALRGGFHASLFSYLDYNIHHSSSHGVTPFYTYALLFVALSVPPVLFSFYRNFQWRFQYRSLIPVLGYFMSFVVIHSAIPHKEERFMIPMLPFFFILISPLAYHLWIENGARIRRTLFLLINGVLLLLTTVNIPQNNVIGLAQYLQRHPSVRSVIDVDESVVLWPEAFFTHAVNRRAVQSDKLPTVLPTQCDEVIAIRAGFQDRLGEMREGLVEVGEFNPGVLEALFVRLNPKQNARRSSIRIYSSTYCLPPPKLG